MKKLLLFSILFFGLKMYSQNAVLKDSVTHLKEVVVNSKKKKGKIIKIKTKGEEIGSDALRYMGEEVNFIQNIPSGYLHSVKFWFNSGVLLNLFKKGIGIDYQDTEFALVIYEVGSDGKPGKAVLDKPIHFNVKKEHRGSIEINLSKLNLPSSNKLFIGLKAITQQKGHNVVVKIDLNKNAVSYCKQKEATSKWGREMGSQLKMLLKVEVDNN